MSTQFDALLGDLDTLHKAIPKDGDAKIVAAKKDGEADAGAGEGGAAAAAGAGDGDGKKKDGDGKTMAKSMTVKLEDGTEVEAVDGTELVKALETTLGALTTRFDANETVLTKAFGQITDLLKALGAKLGVVEEQNKAQAEQIKTLGSEGRGRKAVVTLVEKKPEGTTLAKGGGGEEGMKPDEFMTKAEAQFRAGKITGMEISYIESAFNRGEFQLPPALISKVAG